MRATRLKVTIELARQIAGYRMKCSKNPLKASRTGRSPSRSHRFLCRRPDPISERSEIPPHRAGPYPLLLTDNDRVLSAMKRRYPRRRAKLAKSLPLMPHLVPPLTRRNFHRAAPFAEGATSPFTTNSSSTEILIWTAFCVLIFKTEADYRRREMHDKAKKCRTTSA